MSFTSQKKLTFCYCIQSTTKIIFTFHIISERMTENMEEELKKEDFEMKEENFSIKEEIITSTTIEDSCTVYVQEEENTGIQGKISTSFIQNLRSITVE